MPSHLDAVIFDFDGVIANSEPLHFEAFGRTLADEGFSLTREEFTKWSKVIRAARIGMD